MQYCEVENELEIKGILMTNKKRLVPLWARVSLGIFVYTVIATLSQVLASYVMNISLDSLINPEKLSLNELVVFQLFAFIATFLSVYILRRYIDKKSFLSIGLIKDNIISNVLWGALLAIALVCGMTTMLYVYGSIEIVSVDFNPQVLLKSFLLLLFVAVSEEIFMRGYILNNLMESMHRYTALILSTVIFTLFHAINPHMNYIAVSNLFIAGILLGSVYVYTKNLWFSISLHFFWNFLQSIFGYAISGVKVDSLVKMEFSQDTLLNGGEFGLEGSLLSTVFTALATLLILMYFRKRDNIKTPI